VSKAGNDSDTGLTKDDPKLTITAAMTVASGLSPTSGNRVTVVVQDAGDYNESVTIPDYVGLDAPTAQITPGGNAVIMGLESSINIYKVTSGGTPIDCQGAGRAWVKAGWLEPTGISGTHGGVKINNALADVFIDVDYIDANSRDCIVNIVAGGKVTGRVGEMVGGDAIDAADTGYFDLTIGRVGTTTGVRLGDSSVANLTIQDFSPTSQVALTGSAVVNIFASQATGATGTAVGSSVYNLETPTPESFTETNVVFVSKAGDDANDGLNDERPKLTIGSAITAATALTPTVNDRVEIRILDAGRYSADVILPDYVSLIGPAAEVLAASATTAIVMGIESVVRLYKTSGGNYDALDFAAAGKGWAYISKIEVTGISFSPACVHVSNASADAYIEVGSMEYNTRVGINVSAAGNLRGRVGLLTGSDQGLVVSAAAQVDLSIDSFVATSGGTGDAIVLSASGAVANLTLREFSVVTNQVNIALGAEANIIASRASGSTGTVTGTYNLTVAGGGGGGSDLAATLVLGNITGGTDIAVTAGDSIRGTTVTAVKATGTITINTAPLTAPTTDKLALTSTSSGRTRFLKSVSGARTPGANNFDGSLGTVAALATEIVAAINDVANAFDTLYFATDLGGGVVQIDAVTTGSDGNSLALRKTLTSGGDITLSPTTGFLTGGSNDTSPVLINHGASGAITAARTGSVAGAGRGVGAMDFQSYRASADEVASGQGSVILSGRQNTTFVPNSVIAGSYNRMLPGDDYATSFMFGNRNYADFAPYGMMMGGSFNYIYSAPGATFEREGAGFGPTMMWGAGMKIYDAGQIQGAAGAYFGGYHRWEPGVFTQSNIIAGYRHEMQTGGSYVGACAVFGNQNDLYDAQESIISGVRNNITAAYMSAVFGGFHEIVLANQAIVAGYNINFNASIGGGAFGRDTVVTNASVWGFSGGHFGGQGSTQFALANLGAETTSATVRQMNLHNFDTTPDSTDVLIIRANQAWGFELSVSAYQTVGTGTGSTAYWTFSGLFKRDGASVTTLVGISSPGSQPPAYSDAGASAWRVEVDVDDTTNEALRIRVSGEASKTIRWSAYLRLTQAGAAI
jgi:hypothetical protein